MAQSGIELRDYQRECIDVISKLESGAHLVQMATGLGKTVTFANIPRKGRMLILSHRDELVAQPVKYFDCPVGIEKAECTSDGEEVISASVQTLSRGSRLKRTFKPGDFDLIVTDEAHHALAPSYRKIVDYLDPRLHIGFTATPNRGDGRGLEDVFEDIVFQRDLIWGIEHGYLSGIDCLQVHVDWSTADVKRTAGDFQLDQLDRAVNQPKSNAQVAAAYERYRQGQTLIFASSVKHAYALSELIPNSRVVDGKTPIDERRAIIRDFTARKIDCLINFGVFTEGTDIPLIETILLARPTSNQALYTQMVGRGLRLYSDPVTGYEKKGLTLIDCVGDSGRNALCTAPSLVGIDQSELPEYAGRVINGPLMGLRDRLAAAEDCPEGWVLAARSVDLTASTANIAWIRRADGSKVVSGSGWKVTMSAPDLLDRVRVVFKGNNRTEREYDGQPAAEAAVRGWLEYFLEGQSNLWDTEKVDRWGSRPASPAQKRKIEDELQGELGGIDLDSLTKREAAAVIENAQARRCALDAERYGICPVCGSALRLSRDRKRFNCTSNRWSRRGGEWELVGGCGTSLKVRVAGHKVTVDDFKSIAEKGFYEWRGTRYGFKPAPGGIGGRIVELP